MKEQHFFYAPDLGGEAASPNFFLPSEEAAHAVRVLRLREGDEAWCTDGKGAFYRCEVSLAERNACALNIVEIIPEQPLWQGTLTLAVAPTKHIDRTEWLVEKAVEIGIDCIVPLLCANSERTKLNLDRLERIAISAMKQSRKPYATSIMPLTPVCDFIRTYNGTLCIAHCRSDISQERSYLPAVLPSTGSRAVMIGPEGDFTQQEVQLALKSEATPVTLGSSRLRTETAAVVATTMMHLQ